MLLIIPSDMGVFVHIKCFLPTFGLHTVFVQLFFYHRCDYIQLHDLNHENHFLLLPLNKKNCENIELKLLFILILFSRTLLKYVDPFVSYTCNKMLLYIAFFRTFYFEMELRVMVKSQPWKMTGMLAFREYVFFWKMSPRYVCFSIKMVARRGLF